jgi:hypothetical protein
VVGLFGVAVGSTCTKLGFRGSAGFLRVDVRSRV